MGITLADSRGICTEDELWIRSALIAVCGRTRRIRFAYLPGIVFVNGALASEFEVIEQMLAREHVVDCYVCSGDGRDDEGDMCGACEGSGELVPHGQPYILHEWDGIRVLDSYIDTSESLARLGEAMRGIDEAGR